MDLLRSDWTGLVKKLDAKTVADKLYEHKIISFEDMEKVCTESSRADRNRHLLRLMSKRPWMDGVQFAKIISRVDGNQEIGRQLLLNAGNELSQIVALQHQSSLYGSSVQLWNFFSNSIVSQLTIIMLSIWLLACPPFIY